MVRDIRTSPRGLIAPLKQAELASLRDLQDGKLLALPDAHRARLFDLELIADAGVQTGVPFLVASPTLAAQPLQVLVPAGWYLKLTGDASYAVTYY